MNSKNNSNLFLILFFYCNEKMTDKRWCSINEFMESIKELLNDSLAINVYFVNCDKSKYGWSIEVIGFSIIDKAMKVKPLRYYDVHKLMPKTQYIQFKANKDRNMKEINKGMTNKLYKLIIYTEKTPFKDGFYYHRSIVKVVDNKKLYDKLIKEMIEDKIKYDDELADKTNVKTEDDILDLDEEI